MKLKPLACALLSATLVTQLTACGTIFYPERRGQLTGEIDPGVAILNAIGLLFYLVPGLIAFGVDFATGAIYLPDGRYSVAPERLQEAVDQNGQVDRMKLKAIIKQDLQLDLPIERAQLIERPAAHQLAALGLPARA